jgi:hypothetical protein
MSKYRVCIRNGRRGNRDEIHAADAKSAEELEVIG